jgi:hypothetical protein
MGKMDSIDSYQSRLNKSLIKKKKNESIWEKTNPVRSNKESRKI